MKEFYDELDSKIDSMKDFMLDKITELIAFRSVEGAPEENAPFGKEVDKALECFLTFGEELGFETKNVDNYAGHIQFGNTGELYAVLGHLDVVPEGEGWEYDPYKAFVKDGYICGRGTQDDKGPVVASVIALKALKDCGFVPKNRLRIIAGTNEETNWEGIHHYFMHEEKPLEALTPDAGFPMIFAEKGIISYDFESELKSEKEDGNMNLISIKGGEAANSVAAKTIVKIEFENEAEFTECLRSFKPENNTKIDCTIDGNTAEMIFEGRSAHASTPDEGVNSISAAVDFLNTIGLKGAVADAISLIGEKIGYEIDGKNLGIKGRDEVTGDLTCNLGKLGYANGFFSVTINIRYPIFFSEKMITSQVKEAMAPMKVREHGFLKPLYVSPDSDFIKMLRRVYEDVTGLDSTPFSMGGGTYARAVPKGVAFGAMFPGEEAVAHKPNERMSVDSLLKMAKIYARVYFEWLGK